MNMLKIENTEVMGWEAAIRGMRNPMNSWEMSDSFICKEERGLTNEEIEATCGRCPRNISKFSTAIDACDIYDTEPHFIVGKNDLDLMTRLRNAGTDHRKFMRMITVYLDITAPLYWWKEFDTYKVGTVANSCSTMHKIAAKEFTLDDFSHEHLFGPDDMLSYDQRNDISRDRALTAIDVDGATCYYTPKGLLQMVCNALNYERERYLVALKTEEETGLSAKDIWWQMIQLLPSSYNQRRTVMLNYEVLANIYKSRKNHKLDEWHTFCNWIKCLPYSQLITGEFDVPTCNQKEEQ